MTGPGKIQKYRAAGDGDEWRPDGALTVELTFYSRLRLAASNWLLSWGVVWRNRGRLGSRLQPIADAEVGDKPRIAHVVVDLLADLAGIHTQVLRLGPVVRAPHLLEDRVVGQHPAGVPGQQSEEGKLLRA